MKSHQRSLSSGVATKLGTDQKQIYYLSLHWNIDSKRPCVSPLSRCSSDNHRFHLVPTNIWEADEIWNWNLRQNKPHGVWIHIWRQEFWKFYMSLFCSHSKLHKAMLSATLYHRFLLRYHYQLEKVYNSMKGKRFLYKMHMIICLDLSLSKCNHLTFPIHFLLLKLWAGLWINF